MEIIEDDWNEKKAVVPEKRKTAYRKFLALKSGMDISAFLGIMPQELERLCNNPIYSKYSIPKKKFGYRIIQGPEYMLKRAQKKIGFSLQSIYLTVKPDCSKGFVKMYRDNKDFGKSNIHQNALPHVGKKYLLNLDLKEFFPSIKARRVKQLFSEAPFHFSNEVSTALALLCTIDGRLPIGAPTSPILSNFICLGMDDALTNLATKLDWNYTRYADDLTFSSNQYIDEAALKQVSETIESFGFSLNPKKFRLKTNNKKHVVTGLVVNEKVSVERKKKKEIRAILHDIKTNGVAKAAQKHLGYNYVPSESERTAFVQKIMGHLAFFKQHGVYIEIPEDCFQVIINKSPFPHSV